MKDGRLILVLLFFSFLFFPSISFAAPALTTRFTGTDQGPHVTQLQQMLSQGGFYKTTPTGNYDQATKEAVALFQHQYNIPITPETEGFAGPSTRAKLNELYATAPAAVAPILQNPSSEGGPTLTQLRSQLVSLLTQLLSLLQGQLAALTGQSAATSAPRLTSAPSETIKTQPSTVPVTITSATPATSGSCETISQYGITWTFDKPYPCGNFVNGDWWVAGPVTVVSVSPGWDGTKNGSMLDPLLPNNLGSQGYDSRAYNYQNSLRVQFPVTIDGVKSLISSTGLMAQKQGGAYDTLDTAAVLTVVKSPVTEGTFRPPYVAGNKPFWNISQLDYAKVPSLRVPTGVAVPNLSGAMTRVWLNHGPKTWGSEIHPVSNMPPYPRDSSLQESDISLAALLKTPSQRDYINRLAQLGIDLYPISLGNKDAFQANGGFGSGWKWPILFAGIVFNDSAMKNPPLSIGNPATTVEKFGEDGYTYYGQPTAAYPNGKPLFGEDCAKQGLAFFQNNNCRDPKGLLDSLDLHINNSGIYVFSTVHTWVGQALAARLMDAQAIWNHPAYFDYIDRWVAEGGNYGGAFEEGMWKAYRQAEPATPPPSTGNSGSASSGTSEGSGSSSPTIPPPTVDLSTNLVLHYSFDASTISANSISDQAGSNIGTATGVTTVVGHKNEALSFTNGSVVTNANSAINNLPITTGMTVSLWIKPQQVASGMLVAKNCALGESSGCWALKLVDGALDYSHHGSASSLHIKSAANLVVADQWQHLAVVAAPGPSNASTVHLYLNGVEVGSGGGSSLDADAAKNLYIGNALRGPAYTGLIDDVRLYNQPLSGENINGLYQL